MSNNTQPRKELKRRESEVEDQERLGPRERFGMSICFCARLGFVLEEH